jgi:hypothetical protein
VGSGCMCRYSGDGNFKRGTTFAEAYKDTVMENWDYSRNTISPNEITYGNSRKKVFLICEKGHSFSMTPYNIKMGQWCPVCNRENLSERLRKARFKEDRSFGKLFPQYIKYWSNKNKVSPFEVMAGTDDKYIFVCEKGHEFDIRISNIVYNNRWCPYCSNKKVNEENSFASKNPELVKYWSSKNDKSPYEVTYGSDYKAIFVCEKGHEWKARCADVSRGKWCMQCSNRPKITNEDVDIFLKDKDIKRISDYVNAREKMELKCLKCKRHFKCSYDHIVRLNVGCSYCKQSKGEKAIEKVLEELKVPYQKQKTFKDLVGLNNGLLKFDFYVEYNNKILLIEYDGEFHYHKIYEDDNHEIIVEHDKIKNEYCRKNNIPLLRIPYWEFDNIKEIILNRLNSL